MLDLALCILLFLSTPTIIVATPVELLLNPVERDVVPYDLVWANATHSTLGTDISLSPDADPQIVTGAFKAVGEITKAVCTSAGPTACVATAFASLGVIVLGLWLGSKRDLGIEVNYADPIFEPSATANFHETLAAAIPANGEFIHFANVTYNGVLHHIHFAHGGSNTPLATLRSVQIERKPSKRRRQADTDQDDDGGIVADYSFTDENQSVWNEFGTGDANAFGNDISNILFNVNTLVGCAVVQDNGASNIGMAGVTSVGWNNAAFKFTSPSVQSFFGSCQGA